MDFFELSVRNQEKLDYFHFLLFQDLISCFLTLGSLSKEQISTLFVVVVNNKTTSGRRTNVLCSSSMRLKYSRNIENERKGERVSTFDALKLAGQIVNRE